MPIYSNILEGIALANNGVSRSDIREMSHRLHIAGILSFGWRSILVQKQEQQIQSCTTA